MKERPLLRRLSALRLARSGRRSWPAALLMVTTLIAAHAASGLVVVGGSRAGDATASPGLWARPSLVRVTAGRRAVFRIRIRRRGFHGPILLTVSGLPPGSTGRLTPRRPRGIWATLAILTGPSTPAGRYRATVSARIGRRLRRAPAILIVTPVAPRRGLAAFTVAGAVNEQLVPGVPVAVDLRVTNPADLPLQVDSLTVEIRDLKAPRATALLPCTLADFAVRQYSGRRLTVSAGATRSLGDLGVNRAGWPQLFIIDRPTDQDGCQGATLSLAYTGTGRLG